MYNSIHIPTIFSVPNRYTFHSSFLMMLNNFLVSFEGIVQEAMIMFPNSKFRNLENRKKKNKNRLNVHTDFFFPPKIFSENHFY